jgi:hypothetical protein
MDIVDDDTSWIKELNLKNMQFWQQHNKPIELWSAD